MTDNGEAFARHMFANGRIRRGESSRHLLYPLTDSRRHRHRHRWAAIAKDDSRVMAGWIDRQLRADAGTAASYAISDKLGFFGWRRSVWRTRNQIAQRFHRFP